MTDLDSELQNILIYDILGKDFTESNERFVIIEKYESHGHQIRVGETNIEDAVYFFKEIDKERKFHRRNGQPAIVTKRLRAWYKNGELHRDNNKPALIRLPMNVHDDVPMERYCVDGKNHRDFDKPAIIFEGKNPRQVWYNHGKIHRDKGPAIISKNILFYVDKGYCHKVIFIWGNKFITKLIENPLILISVFLTLMLWLKFF
jgi:hypothetical protein